MGIILVDSRTGLKFWLQWVVLTSIGWLLRSAVLFVGMGLGIGIAQRIPLRTKLNRAAWWIFASIVGFTVGAIPVAIAILVASFDTSLSNRTAITFVLLGGGVMGVVGGLGQWIVLRSRVRRAGWWVLIVKIPFLVPVRRGRTTHSKRCGTVPPLGRTGIRFNRPSEWGMDHTEKKRGVLYQA